MEPIKRVSWGEIAVLAGLLAGYAGIGFGIYWMITHWKWVLYGLAGIAGLMILIWIAAEVEYRIYGGEK